MSHVDILLNTHNVKDTDASFVVNPLTREITTTSEKKVLMQGDHKSERFTFEMPRYVENHDMALCNVVQIYYLNVDGKTKKSETGIYTVDDFAVMKYIGDRISFSWLVSSNATMHAGNLNFMVRFACMKGTEIDYAWNTGIYSDIQVVESLESPEVFETKYIDVIQQWKDTVMQELNIYVDVSVKNHVNVAQIETNKKNISELDKEVSFKVGDLAREQAALASRMDTFTKLPSGSTAGDAELADARIGVDGAVYETAGDAVRGQVGHAMEYAEADKFHDYIYNRLNPMDFVKNQYIDPVNNIFFDSTSYTTSGYILVRKNETLWFYDETGATVPARFVALYDANKNIIKPDTTLDESRTYTQSGNVAYIRISLRNSANPATCMVMPKGRYFEFIPYGKMIRKSDMMSSTYDLEKAFYYNRLIPDKCIVGKYASWEDGSVKLNENCVVSNIIKVYPGEKLRITSSEHVSSMLRMVAAYDMDMNFLPDLSDQNVESFANTLDEPILTRITINLDLFDSGCMISSVDTPFYIEPGVYICKGSGSSSDKSSKDTSTITEANISANTRIELTEFPHNLKKNVAISFSGDVSSFTGLDIGHGGTGYYSGVWLTIDSTNVVIKKYLTSDTILETVEHGLLIKDFINVALSYGDDGIMHIDIITNGDSFTHTFNTEYSPCGAIFTTSHGAMSNVVLNATCCDLEKELWLVGDSYFGVNDSRVAGQLKNLGFFNYLLLGQPGINSINAYADVVRALNYATPKTIVWYLGMNDGATAAPYETYMNNLKSLCEMKGITLILNRVPTVPTISKEAISEVIINSGLRYIDSYKAVGATSGGWNTGLLSGDGVHPTVLGAKTLAMRMLIDVPEIMKYGR